MANTFGSILDRQSSEIERPKPIPVGNYVCVVKGLPKMDKSAKKGTEFVEFTLSPLQAMEDVDGEALDAALSRKDGSKKSLVDMTIRATYYLTEDAIWRLNKFLNDAGAGDDTQSLRERVENATGCQVIATIKHTASDDGEAIYANLAGTAAVE